MRTSPATYSRGESYFAEGRVMSLSINDVANGVFISALVMGSRRHEYDVFVGLTREGMHSDCNCPVDNPTCKHSVAVILAYLAHKNEGASSPLSHYLKDFINQVRVASGTNDQSVMDNSDSQTFYILSSSYSLKGRVSVDMLSTRLRKDGKGYVKGKSIDPNYIGFREAGEFTLTDNDIEIAAWLAGLRGGYSFRALVLEGSLGARCLQAMLDTGRCCWERPDNVITAGDAIEPSISWQEDGQGYRIQLSPDVFYLETSPAMYIDHHNGHAGVVTGAFNGPQLQAFKAAPLVPHKEAAAFSKELARHSQVVPPIDVNMKKRSVVAKLQPHITITTHYEGQPCLRVQFYYESYAIAPIPKKTEHIVEEKDETVLIHRNVLEENRALQTLIDLGLSQLGRPSEQGLCMALSESTLRHMPMAWFALLHDELPKLEQQGWTITCDDPELIPEVTDASWEFSLLEQESGSEWFDLRFDLDVNGEKMPLAPLISPFLGLSELPEELLIPLPGNQFAKLPSKHIEPYITAINELLSRVNYEDKPIKVSRYDALLIDSIDDYAAGVNHLKGLAKKLKNSRGVIPVKPPAKLKATLRDYQQEGLNWLQFLTRNQLNGILADDMGLGKTLQTLAHIAKEKQLGKLKQPALVVAPTSLMTNWRTEAARFTPGLAALILHGHQRHESMEKLNEFDLIVTTYPLIVRDFTHHQDMQYHIVVLDEAQYIKNSETKLAKYIRKLNCNHKLCLTGTPMENHLGELWSQFDFLLPSFLGNKATFQKYYRTPIEKHADNERHQSLTSRIQPFMLRRTKDNVAKELPDKTVIIKHVDMGKKQAEIYEKIRLTVDKNLRQAIEKNGLAKSQIAILDALLKLRQVCCDPRLVKSMSVNAKHSAKLDYLKELLQKLIDEDKKILLFSQFTSMLSLIEPVLKSLNIRYSKLTGQTRNREQAINEFKQHKTQLFLISLKAGGTGLNLTEADSVIIYDPWWNPAVERQAIDRTHRIGQTKPVFIYKLVTQNTVEEKILELQRNKQALADSIHNSDSIESKAVFDGAALEALLAPIESI